MAKEFEKAKQTVRQIQKKDVYTKLMNIVEKAQAKDYEGQEGGA